MGGGGQNSLNSPTTSNNDPLDDKLQKEQEWENPTYKNYEDYFEDLNITSQTITEQDLTGSGSELNPYVIHSTRGFLWLSNYTLSRIYLGNKHVELACDIILNDESFNNKEGTPSGGDGVVYNWKEVRDVFNGVYFNGNNHIINGVYYNKQEEAKITVFGVLKEIKNLKAENIYLSSNNAATTLICNAYIVDNIHFLSGYIIATSSASGIVDFAYTEISNCTNRATVISTGTVAGGITTEGVNNLVLKNCINYGDVEASWAVAGIVPYIGNHDQMNVSIHNCINYGNIRGENHVGGMVGIAYNYGVVSYLRINDCKNYGTIVASSNNAAGMVGAVEAYAEIIGCKNYGKTESLASWRNAGGIIGNALQQYLPYNGIISVIDCENYSSSPFIGVIISTVDKKLDVIIKNCQSITSGVESLFTNWLLRANFFMENCYFKTEEKENVYLMLEFGNTDEHITCIRSVVIETKGEQAATKRMIKATYYNKIDVQGFVIFSETGGAYYGTDFSGLCYDWKNGKFGVKALNGKGFYQGKVTEDLLVQKGFEKKSA